MNGSWKAGGSERDLRERMKEREKRRRRRRRRRRRSNELGRRSQRHRVPLLAPLPSRELCN